MSPKDTIIETMVSDIDDRRFDAFTSGRSIVAAQIAALSAAGYAIVPVEPDEAMREAGALCASDLDADLYRVMIRASNKEG